MHPVETRVTLSSTGISPYGIGASNRMVFIGLGGKVTTYPKEEKAAFKAARDKTLEARKAIIVLVND